MPDVNSKSINRGLFYFLLALIILRPSLDIFSPKKFQLHPDLPELNLDMLIGGLVFLIGLFFVFRNFGNIRRTPLFWPIGLFLGLSLVSVFYSGDIFLSAKEFIRLATIFFLYFLAYWLVKSEKDWQWLLKAVVLSYFIPGLVALIQYVLGIGLPDEFGGFQRIYGTFAHPNPFSFYTFFILALVLSLALSKSSLLSLRAEASAEAKQSHEKQLKVSEIGSAGSLKIFLWLSVGLLTFFLFATYTRSALVCFFAFILLFGLFKYRQLLLAAALLFAVVYFTSPVFQERIRELFNLDPYGSIVWRFRMWQDMLPLFFWHPWFGYGLGLFTKLAEFYRGFKWGSLEAHNDFLKILIENGIVGLLAYFFLIIILLKNLLGIFRKTAENQKVFALGLIAIVLALLATSFFDNVLRGTALEWNLWILLAGWLRVNVIRNA